MRGSGTDPGLDLFRGQLCCFDYRAIGEIGSVNSVLFYNGETRMAVNV